MLTELGRKFFVRCRTSEHAKELIESLIKDGCSWYSGESLSPDDTRWHRYVENTCYLVHDVKERGLRYCDTNYASTYCKEYEILEFDDTDIAKCKNKPVADDDVDTLFDV